MRVGGGAAGTKDCGGVTADPLIQATPQQVLPLYHGGPLGPGRCPSAVSLGVTSRRPCHPSSDRTVGAAAEERRVTWRNASVFAAAMLDSLMCQRVVQAIELARIGSPSSPIRREGSAPDGAPPAARSG
jgi:hypothetical protein